MLTVRVNQIIKNEVEVPGLGARIKLARESTHRSIAQLAKEVGISRNYWYQLEAEAVLGSVSISTLRKIEEVLGADFGVNF